MIRSLALGAGGAVLLVTGDAAAVEPVFRGSGHGAVVFDRHEVAGGGGGSLAVALNPGREPLLIIPEVVGTVGYYAGGFDGLYARALGSFRFGGALVPVEPTIITRVGYGFATLGPPDAEEGEHGVALQIGPALEYRIDRRYTFGGELLYDLFIDASDGNTAHMLTLGVTFAWWPKIEL